jgi:hypothetical protein
VLRCATLRHRTVFMMVCVLLLKAAVPMLASGAAGLQGKPVGEICTVYGVVTVADDAGHADDAGRAGHHGPSHESAAAHGGDHCALAGLAALAADDEAAPFVAPPVHPAPAPAPAYAGCAGADSCALWVARLKQGPPGSA